MKIITKQVPKSFLETEGFTIPLDEILDVLSGLENSDYTNRLVFYNDDIKKWLLSKNAIQCSVKGSCYKSDNFESLRDEIEVLVYGYAETKFIEGE